MAIIDITLSLNSQNITFFPNSKGITNYFSGQGTPPRPPELVYIENVMPTIRGFRSLNTFAFITSVPPNLTTAFQQLRYFFVRTVTDQSGWYFSTNNGANRTHYSWNNATSAWVTTFTLGSGADTVVYCSQAFVNGTSYVFTSALGTGVSAVITIGDNFAGVNILTIQGITIGDMKGISSALNYLIAFDRDTIYWSAPGVPLDFRPIVSTVKTGAGASQLQDLTGYIVSVFPIAGGFLIYTTEEVIAARYSGNSLNPWIFAEVKGSGGIVEFQEVVGMGSTAQAHFVYTKSGFQEINLTQATQILPELTDFLTSNWNTVSNNDGTFTVSEVTDTTISKIVFVSYVANRYLCVSYSNTDFASPQVYQGIWVYDILLKRYGHIIIAHSGTFDYMEPLFEDLGSSTIPLNSLDRVGLLGVVLSDGKVTLYRLSAEGKNTSGDVAITGELIFSEFNLTRSRRCSIIEVELAGDIEANYTATVGILTRDKSTGLRASEVAFSRFPAGEQTYQGDVTGSSHRLRVSGNFDLTGIDVDIVQRGRN